MSRIKSRWERSSLKLPKEVTIVEVGPRDGLQNEPETVPTATKVAFIEKLAAAGLPVVETTSFVHPKWVPQLADASEVLRNLTELPGTRYPVLVPNAKGMERAIEAGVKEIAVFTAASETFNKKNLNMSIDESLQAIAEVIKMAQDNEIRVRGYVSTCFGCPYEGEVPAEKVVAVTQKLLALRVFEVSLGDTIGVAQPQQVESVLKLILESVPTEQLAVHFHDTRGTALANILAALQMGIATVDSSSGGLGGCPYAPGAAGNVATEDVVYMLQGMGVETGVDLEKLVDATQVIADALDKPLPGKYFQAAVAKKTRV